MAVLAAPTMAPQNEPNKEGFDDCRDEIGERGGSWSSSTGISVSAARGFLVSALSLLGDGALPRGALW